MSNNSIPLRRFAFGGLAILVVAAGISYFGFKRKISTADSVGAKIRLPAQVQKSVQIPAKPQMSNDERSSNFTTPILAPKIGEVEARHEQIQTLIELFEAGSWEKVQEALNLMGGNPKLPDGSGQGRNYETAAFYCRYVDVVIQSGNDEEKAQAARLLRAMARAAPLEKNTSTMTLTLWGILEYAIQYTVHDTWSPLASPPDQMEQQLLKSRVYARLQPANSH